MAALISVECPRCQRPVMARVTGLLYGAESRLQITPDDLSVRRHAGCFGPNGGGEPLPIGVAA